MCFHWKQWRWMREGVTLPCVSFFLSFFWTHSSLLNCVTGRKWQGVGLRGDHVWERHHKERHSWEFSARSDTDWGSVVNWCSEGEKGGRRLQGERRRLAAEGRGELVWVSEEDENKRKTDFLFSFILMEQTTYKGQIDMKRWCIKSNFGSFFHFQVFSWFEFLRWCCSSSTTTHYKLLSYSSFIKSWRSYISSLCLYSEPCSVFLLQYFKEREKAVWSNPGQDAELARWGAPKTTAERWQALYCGTATLYQKKNVCVWASRLHQGKCKLLVHEWVKERPMWYHEDTVFWYKLQRQRSQNISVHSSHHKQ